MTAMFNRKDQSKQESADERRQGMRAEYERLAALSLSDLAVEVMVKGFGPGGPGADDAAISLGQANIGAGPSAVDISFEFVPKGGSFPSPDDIQLREQLAKLIAEGLQELEHASLVRCQMHTASGYFDWAATRRGRAALNQNDVAAVLAQR
jgi:hypothetical protein